MVPASTIGIDHMISDERPTAAAAAATAGSGTDTLDRRARLREIQTLSMPLVTLAGVAIGAGFWAADRDVAANAAWAATAVIMLIPLAWSVISALLRGDLGVDIIALLAIVAGLSMGEYLPAAVVALMLSGGNALEGAAIRRSRRELTSLLARAPRVTHRRTADGVEDVPVGDVAPGDAVLVLSGEVVPVDGIVTGDDAVVDEAALTGESLPVTVPPGGSLRSGATNAGGAIDLQATRPASESAYAAIVRLVSEAGAQKAPMVRMADRYAVFFLVLTLVMAGLAWGLSGDPVRALAVLVVATPCPLILAAPIALVAGVSRAARKGVIVKGAGVIEGLGKTSSVVLDKTGTLTVGRPAVDRIVATGDLSEERLLALAASLEQMSAHVLAAALVQEARGRELTLETPRGVKEDHGRGVTGTVGGIDVAAGTPGLLRDHGYVVDDPPPADADGRATIMVGVDGRAAGYIVMADHVRHDAVELVERLHEADVTHVAMATGDNAEVADAVAGRVGVDHVYSAQTPEGKMDLVRELREEAGDGTVVMVGDGINDAPALALADVGIAMGTGDQTASSQAADAVITVDRIERVADAIEIGRRSVHIAQQSIVVGMALSIGAMFLAAFGYIDPLEGALLQEAIDIAVILNALRALRG